MTLSLLRLAMRHTTTTTSALHLTAFVLTDVAVAMVVAHATSPVKSTQQKLYLHHRSTHALPLLRVRLIYVFAVLTIPVTVARDGSR